MRDPTSEERSHDELRASAGRRDEPRTDYGNGFVSRSALAGLRRRP